MTTNKTIHDQKLWIHGGHGMTNFGKGEKEKYEKAIKMYPELGLSIGPPLMPLHNSTNYLALYIEKSRDCTDFWRSFDKLKKDEDISNNDCDHIWVKSLGLIDAVWNNDFNLVKKLINEGADVNIKGKFDNTPLHDAKSVEVAELLVKNGAGVNINNSVDSTPLHYAMSVEIAELLIKNGADVHAANIFDNTPLHYAKNVEIAELLVKNGADINVKNWRGESPYQCTANTQLIKLLENHGAVNSKPNDKSSTDCDHIWVESEGFWETYVDCKECGRKQEDVES